MRKLTASILLAIGLSGSAVADTTPATPNAEQSAPLNSVSSNSSAVNGQPIAEPKPDSATPVISENNSPLEGNEGQPVAVEELVSAQPKGGFNEDLSVWGMYQNADVVVKVVMIGLIIASVITWALFFSKGAELITARRRLKKEQRALADVASLDEALSIAEKFSKTSISYLLLNEAASERTLSLNSTDLAGTKERTTFRLERAVAAISRYMGRGNGYLATIGAISPFVGLFGTVWGIMNSFIGIAHSQTTNLAVVAPGIAEALLATAIGLIAAIPAVVIYNIFARMINSYRGQVGDMAAQAALLLGRDLDLENSKAR